MAEVLNTSPRQNGNMPLTGNGQSAAIRTPDEQRALNFGLAGVFEAGNGMTVARPVESFHKPSDKPAASKPAPVRQAQAPAPVQEATPTTPGTVYGREDVRAIARLHKQEVGDRGALSAVVRTWFSENHGDPSRCRACRKAGFAK